MGTSVFTFNQIVHDPVISKFQQFFALLKSIVKNYGFSGVELSKGSHLCNIHFNIVQYAFRTVHGHPRRRHAVPCILILSCRCSGIEARPPGVQFVLRATFLFTRVFYHVLPCLCISGLGLALKWSLQLQLWSEAHGSWTLWAWEPVLGVFLHFPFLVTSIAWNASFTHHLLHHLLVIYFIIYSVH